MSGASRSAISGTATDRDENERGGGGKAPDDHLGAHPPLAAAAAVDRQRQLVDRGGQLRVADLEPREHRVAGLAEAQHARPAPTGARARS